MFTLDRLRTTTDGLGTTVIRLKVDELLGMSTKTTDIWEQ